MNIDPRTVVSHALQQSNTPEQKRAKDLKSIKEMSHEFEAMFVMEMYKAMRKTVPKSDLFSQGMATEMFQEMLDIEVIQSSAKGRGLGLGEEVYRQMAELSELVDTAAKKAK